MERKVTVNTDQCQKIGAQLRTLKLTKEHFQRPFLTFLADTETKLRAFLFASAICHQTHTLIFKQKNLKGWACIEDVFTKLGEENSELLQPDFLVHAPLENIVKIIETAFSEDSNPENCTLDKVEERANFLVNISRILNEKYSGKVTGLLNASNNFLINKGAGLYELLTDFPEFADPHKKKSTLFVMLSFDAGLFNIKDFNSIEPVMDYHMQRLMLRTGCIEVIDENLKHLLIEKTKIPSDDAIRSAAVEAVRQIAFSAKKNYFEIDEILWALGRSCCHVKILCANNICDKNPCTLTQTVELPDHKICVFTDVCKGEKNEEYRKYWQPIVETNFY